MDTIDIKASLNYDKIFMISENYMTPGNFIITTVDGNYRKVNEKITKEKCKEIMKVCGRAEITEHDITIGGREIDYPEIDYFSDDGHGIKFYMSDGEQVKYKFRNHLEAIVALKKYVKPRLAEIDYVNKCVKIPKRIDDFAHEPCRIPFRQMDALPSPGDNFKTFEIIRRIPFTSICNIYVEPLLEYSVISTTNGCEITVFGLTYDDHDRRDEIALGKLGGIYTENTDVCVPKTSIN